MRSIRSAGPQFAFVAVLATAGVALAAGVGRIGSRTIALVVVSLILGGMVWINPTAGIGIVVASAIFSAFVRRIFPAPDPAVDLAAILPYVIAAPLAWRGLRDRPPAAVVLLVGWAALTALLKFDAPLVGLAGWLNLAVPLLVAVGVGSVPNGPETFRRNMVISGTIASAYAIAQYFVPFSWDVRWQQSAHFLSANRLGTSSFRPFGPLPSPGTMAVVAAVALVLVLLPSTPVHGLARACASTVCGVMVLVSQVRSVWIAVAATILVLFATARGHAARTVGGVLLLAITLVLIVPGRTTLLSRAQTFSDLSGDGSFSARANLLRDAGSLTTPMGRGVGQLSAGSRIQGDHTIDNGYLVILGELGVIGFGLFLWVVQATARRSEKPDVPVLIFLLVINAAGFAVGGISGVALWPCTGLARTRHTGVKSSQSASFLSTRLRRKTEPVHAQISPARRTTSRVRP